LKHFVLICAVLLYSSQLSFADEGKTGAINLAKPSIVAIIARVDANRFAIMGSGFFVDNQGRVATCDHVIANLTQIYCIRSSDLEKSSFLGYVTTQEGLPQLNLPIYQILDTLLFIKASIFNYATKYDLVILSTNLKETPFLSFGDYKQINEGNDLVFLGFPFGFNRVVTHTGMVSYKGQINISGDVKDVPIEAVQIDGIVNRGNSGGPLISVSQGKVVGIIKASHGNIGPYLQAINKGEIKTEGIGLGQIDFGIFTREVSSAIDRHIQMGIGYAISVDYIKPLMGK
jgi:S1-C subfamily serine protease